MKDNNTVSRRDFLKIMGAGVGSVAAGATLAGCDVQSGEATEGGDLTVPTDKMTYRLNHSTNDKVSLLGYGCMRWPLRRKLTAQEMK